MQPAATSGLIRRGRQASGVRLFVLFALVFSVLASSRPCLAMFAEASARPHCSKHENGSQRKAPSQEPCKKVPELCCIEKAPGITVTPGDDVWNTASFARQETIDYTRNAFLASAEVLRWPASSYLLHSVLRI